MSEIVSISWRIYLSWDRGRIIVKHPNLLTPTSLLEESDHLTMGQWDGTKQGKAIAKISTETESDGVWGFKLGANTRSLEKG